MTEERTRRTFDAEFKRQAVRLADESGKKAGEIEDELGLYQGAIRHWRKELKEDSNRAFPGTGHQKPEEAEIRRLKRENEILRQERDILKKAAVILAKNPSIGID